MSFRLNGVDVESGGPEDRLLLWNRVRDVTGLSRSTAWRLQRIGDFPEPVRISLNRVGWWESELTAWKATRKLRRPERPKSLIPSRAAKQVESVRSTRPPDEDAPLATPGRASAARPAPTTGAPVGSRTRKRAASVDQIDFGF